MHSIAFVYPHRKKSQDDLKHFLLTFRPNYLKLFYTHKIYVYVAYSYCLLIIVYLFIFLLVLTFCGCLSFRIPLQY